MRFGADEFFADAGVLKCTSRTKKIFHKNVAKLTANLTANSFIRLR